MKTLQKLKDDALGILSLFTSVSTLICCALPTLLVVLGLGATMAGLVSDFPILVTLSLHKEWIFFVAASLIGFNLWYIYRKPKKDITCEIPSTGEESACDTASRWSKMIAWVSFGLLGLGFFMAYLIVPIFQYFER